MRKMGRIIASMAEEAGDEVVLRVDESNRASLRPADLRGADVAIEFSRPEAAVGNIDLALAAGVPVVVGTTGWLAELPAVTERVEAREGALFWASNFSIGVNIFFATARRMAGLVEQYGGYTAAVREIHHTQKLDAPSGTGITLAETVAQELSAFHSWELVGVESPVPQTQIAPAGQEPANGAGDLARIPITSVREPGVAGTHVLSLESPVDSLELKHTAHSRAGFAQGALAAARWLVGKKGVFTMQDMLSL